jgi:hypothetical protein
MPGGDPKSPDWRVALHALLSDLDTMIEPTTPALRRRRRIYSRTWKSESADFVIAIARALHASGTHRWIGYELIRNHPRAFAALNDRIVACLALGLNSWGSVDAFARILSGPAWAQGYVSDALIGKWARAHDRWLRRTAIVSTVALNVPGDGGHTDSERTLAICSRLADDPDGMVQKAISWALRALAVRDVSAVSRFLNAHRAQLSAQVLREVSNKIRTGLKNPRASQRRILS